MLCVLVQVRWLMMIRVYLLGYIMTSGSVKVLWILFAFILACVMLITSMFLYLSALYGEGVVHRYIYDSSLLCIGWTFWTHVYDGLWNTQLGIVFWQSGCSHFYCSYYYYGILWYIYYWFSTKVCDMVFISFLMIALIWVIISYVDIWIRYTNRVIISSYYY